MSTEGARSSSHGHKAFGFLCLAHTGTPVYDTDTLIWKKNVLLKENVSFFRCLEKLLHEFQ